MVVDPKSDPTVNDAVQELATSGKTELQWISDRITVSRMFCSALFQDGTSSEETRAGKLSDDICCGWEVWDKASPSFFLLHGARGWIFFLLVFTVLDQAQSRRTEHKKLFVCKS